MLIQCQKISTLPSRGISRLIFINGKSLSQSGNMDVHDTRDAISQSSELQLLPSS